MTGEGVPRDRTIVTPVSLVDFVPTILEAAGVPAEEDDQVDLPGTSLFDVLAGSDTAERTVFGEYHGEGAISGVFMLRRHRWKYIHYVGLPPQLFDLETDPEELIDLANDPAHAETLASFERQLRTIVEPEAIDAQAKADQAALIERHGGEQAVIGRGSSGATPPPGAEPIFG